MKTGPRGAAPVLVALSFVAAGCEIAFPFDRSLIPEDASVLTQVDAGSFSEDAAPPREDAQPVPDAGADSSSVVDGATDHDVTVDASLDGTISDGASPVDAVTDVAIGTDASADAGDGSD